MTFFLRPFGNNSSRPMKTKLACFFAMLAASTSLFAQGIIVFYNGPTGALPGAPVINSLTGSGVKGPGFAAALYIAPDGVTDENQLVVVGPPCPFPNTAGPGGYWFPSNRTINLPIGQWATAQARVWELAYGATYEAAAAAPPMNGRTALIGKSALLRVRLATPNTVPPEPPQRLVEFGLQSFAIESISVPSLYINDRIISEGTNGAKQAVFTVTLDPPSDQTVSVDFATADGTATAGSDYTAASGSLTFAPGQTTTNISITVTADVPVENDEIFYVNLGNAVNAPIQKGQGSCVITEVRVTGIRLDVAVSFNTVLGHSYTVEKTDDGQNWNAVTGAEAVPGTGAIVSVYDQGGGAQSQRMYRARLID